MAKVWAHRGASGYAPENTLEAFALAAEQGAYGIELDVQMTSDGKLVVIHDYTIDRTSNGSGRVADMTYGQLCEYNYHAAFSDAHFYKIPLMEEVLAQVKPTGMHINIEIKCDSFVRFDGIEAALDTMVKATGMEDRILYSSFDHYTLRRMKFINPFAKTGILYEACLYQPWTYAKGLQASALHPHHSSLYEPMFIDLAHREGMEINTWTVNDENSMRILGGKGVDGIITNYPDVAKRVLTEIDCLY